MVAHSEDDHQVAGALKATNLAINDEQGGRDDFDGPPDVLDDFLCTPDMLDACEY